MATRAQHSTDGKKRPSITPHDKKVRHVVGQAGQRPVEGVSEGPSDGGDWMAERIEPARPAKPKD